MSWESTLPSAYISGLRRSIEQEPSAQTAARPNLRERFLMWFENLPEISRHRPYSMIELEEALGTQGKYLSPILLNLGWQRRRKWASKTQYLRYWVPPS